MDTSPTNGSPVIPDPDASLDRLLARAGTPDELEELEHTVRSAGIPPEALAQALQFFGPATVNPERDLAAERARLLDRIQVAQQAPSGKARSVLGRHATVWGATAFLALITVALEHTWRATPHERGDTRSHVYTTHVGERATIVLSDGSHVTLAPNTTLSTAAGFGGSAREVTLRGQARFDVPARSQTPFIVRTSGQSTRVLGTTFDVRRYANERATRVTVMTGKVVVENTKRSARVTLAGGMTGRVSDTGGTVADSGHATAYTVWSDGQLVFTNARVGDMLDAIGPWYGYDIRVVGTDSAALLSQHASAVFDVTQRAETFRLLRRLLGVTMTIDGSVMTLRIDHAPVPPSRMAPVPWQSTHRPAEVGR